MPHKTNGIPQDLNGDGIVTKTEYRMWLVGIAISFTSAIGGYLFQGASAGAELAKEIAGTPARLVKVERQLERVERELGGLREVLEELLRERQEAKLLDKGR